MVQPIYTIHDLKTGKIRKISKTALDIAKKHGMDTHWEILPNAETLKSIPKKIQESTPTAQPIEVDEPVQFIDPISDQPVKKSKKKNKTENE